MVALLPASDPLWLRVHGGTDAWLEIEEVGAEVRLGGAPTFRFEVTVPPRYGRFFMHVDANLDVDVSRLQAAKSRAAVRFTLHCAVSQSTLARIEWYERAAAVSVTMLPVSNGQPLETTIHAIDALSDGAPDAAASALVEHLRAQALFTANRTTESVRAFGAAQAAWTLVADPARALVARVGQAEELNRSGRYRDALDLAKASTQFAETEQYFATRLTFSRCLAERYMGQLGAAATCYANAVSMEMEAGELAEASGLKLALADVLRGLDQRAAAEKEATQAYQMAQGPDAPILKGRANLLLYDLLLDRGQIAPALIRINDALGQFESVHSTRWEANAMLRAAWMYAQFDLLDEARIFVDAARQRLSERDAPARVAAAALLAADIARRAGDVSAALASAHSAEAIYSRLEMPIEFDACRVLIADLEMDAGRVGAAATILRMPGRALGPTLKHRLAEIRLAVAEGDVATARRLLARLKVGHRSLPETVAIARLDAMSLAKSGKAESALRGLRAIADRIKSAASTSQNPLLSELMIRQIAPLRSLAMELAIQNRGASSKGEVSANLVETWHWLQLRRTPRSAERRSSTEDTVAFDEIVASELLVDPFRATGSRKLASARRLLDVIAQPVGEPVGHLRDRFTLTDMQSSLPEDSAYAAYLDAGRTGVMLWLTPHDAQLIPVVNASTLSGHKIRLLKLVSDPASPLARIRDAADALTDDLLATAASFAPPKTLLLDASAELADIPWAVLAWSRGGQELVETSEISIVEPEGPRDVPGQGSARAHLLFARSMDSDRQPDLPVASIEKELVDSALVESGIAFAAETRIDRASIFSALKQPHGWVHFALHGQADPHRIGYAGIWIPDSDRQSPPFISALDVLDSDVASDLVVLGTCQSAQRSMDTARSSLSFADAFSRAGAANVVAALWPISDSAAALWVPAFYRRLGDGREEYSEALRSAQLHLRATRRFRHPYYWSSLVHLTHSGSGKFAASPTLAP